MRFYQAVPGAVTGKCSRFVEVFPAEIVLRMCQELGELYSKYQKKGLVILGFPCNQFNNQEPGDNKEIKKFAKSRGADFPMMSKIEVNGPRGTCQQCAVAQLLIMCIPTSGSLQFACCS